MMHYCSVLLGLLPLFFLCFSPWLVPSVRAAPLASRYPFLSEESFEAIKNSAAERLVVFYYSSESSSDRVLSVVNRVAKRLQKSLPQFRFVGCDGDLAENSNHFKEASFNNGQFVFTSVPVEGILKYTGDISVGALSKYIESKYYEKNPDDLLLFTDEEEFFERMDGASDDEPIRPQIVWFTETWCDLCKRLRPALEIAATYFKDKGIDVLEVSCSANEVATEFCTRHQVRNFPTTVLFDGEGKHSLPSNDSINVLQLEDFVKEKIKPTKKNKKTKKAKKVKASQQEDEENKEEEKEKEIVKEVDAKQNEKQTKQKSAKGKFSKPKSTHPTQTTKEEKKTEEESTVTIGVTDDETIITNTASTNNAQQQTAIPSSATPSATPFESSLSDRIAALENELSAIKSRLQKLESQ